MTDVGAFFFIENEADEMKCRECGDEIYEYEDGLCYYCEEDEKEPNIYDDIDCHPDYNPKTDSIYPDVDDSLNEVSMGRFDDDPPEW